MLWQGLYWTTWQAEWATDVMCKDAAPRVSDDPAARRKASASITRPLRLLCAHKLITKIEGTHRYLVTDRGRNAIAAIIAAKNAPLKKLQQCA